MIVYGFKAFDEALIAMHDYKFELDKTYHIDGDIKFMKNGFHMCENIEDTLRYVNGFYKPVITKVKGYGIVDTYNDYDNDFYNMYCVSDIEILKVLTREEVLQEILKYNNMEFRIQRFISLYKLTEEEIEIIRKECSEVHKLDNYIAYYQYNDKKAFSRGLTK